MGRLLRRFLVAVLAVSVVGPAWAQTEAPAFSKEQLEQLLAPIALYPDSLLTQVLMAATYPAQVAEAVSWSAARPNDKGDAAVTKADGQGWEPSVTSLVAFPQVLATMGQKPEWVQDLGDAFLAQPNDTMDAVQRLRQAAQAAGHLKSNEQQKVVVQSPAPQQTVIVIEPAQPQVVYVPMYNPTVVYGAWGYPAYPPYYFPPPPRYYVGNALLTGMAFGAGLAITNSLWGGYNWGRNDVDININRYNNVNVNRRISSNQTSFTHNSAGRKGVPYRDAKVDQRFGKNVAGKDARNDYRGRDANDAKRDAARDTLTQRTNDPRTRERLQQEAGDRKGDPGTRDRSAAGKDRPGAGAAPDRTAVAKDRRPAAGAGPGAGAPDRSPGGSHRADDRAGDRAAPAARPAPAPRDNALKGAGNGNAERANLNRGQASRQAAAKPAARPQPKPAARPAAGPKTSSARPAPKPQAGAARAGGGARGGAKGR